MCNSSISLIGQQLRFSAKVRLCRDSPSFLTFIVESIPESVPPLFDEVPPVSGKVVKKV